MRSMKSTGRPTIAPEKIRPVHPGEQLHGGGSMTDPKGDRSKGPSQQTDPDLFTHVVKKTDEGMVIRGAKAHQTGAVNSHEMLIMPTQASASGRQRLCRGLRGAGECPGRDHDLRAADQRRAQNRGRNGYRQPRVLPGGRGGSGRVGGCFRPLGEGLHVRRDGISPGCWWNASRPCTARIMAGAKVG